MDRRRRENAQAQAGRIRAEAMKRLGSRKVTNLSLEEALEIKELVDLAAKGVDPYPVKSLQVSLDEHIGSLYEVEAAPEMVEVLGRLYKERDKLQQEIEELKVTVETLGRDLHSAKTRGLSYGENKDARGVFIKKSEEDLNVMLIDLDEKALKMSLIDAETPRLLAEIQKLKREYLVSHGLPKSEGDWMGKMISYGMLSNAKIAVEQDKLKNKRRANASALYANSQREKEKSERESALWAARMHGVSPTESAASLSAQKLRMRPIRKGNLLAAIYTSQRATKNAQNAAEQKALRNLNARESEKAANLIFPSQNRRNQTRRKQTWGIPNVGPGFGGSRKRRRSRKN